MLLFGRNRKCFPSRLSEMMLPGPRTQMNGVLPFGHLPVSFKPRDPQPVMPERYKSLSPKAQRLTTLPILLVMSQTPGGQRQIYHRVLIMVELVWEVGSGFLIISMAVLRGSQKICYSIYFDLCAILDVLIRL